MENTSNSCSVFFLSSSKRVRSSSFLWLRGEVALPFPCGGDGARGVTLDSRLCLPHRHANEVKWWIAEPNYRGKMYEEQIEQNTQKASGQDKLVFFDPKTKGN